MSTNDKALRLQNVAASIQQRFGPRVIHSGFPPSDDLICIPTGFSLLDQALGVGGIPRSRLTEIAGIPTSGMSSLALRIAAQAQAQGDVAVAIDLSRTFDPQYAVACCVQLERLLVVRPPDAGAALDLTRELIGSGAVGIVILDVALGDYDPSAVRNGIARLLPTLAPSFCALLVLTAPGADLTSAFSPYATLRLQLQRQRWLRRRSDVRGYRTRVAILKNKLAPPARAVEVTIGFGRGML